MSEKTTVEPVADETRAYQRFHFSQRIEHWVQMASFTILAITGLVQKYSVYNLSKGIMGVLGGIEKTRLIHHTAAIVLMLAVVYHIGGVIYRLYVRRHRPTMLPSMYDIRAAYQTLAYNLGFAKNPPQQGRYTFEEKMEYWAFAWGTIIMVITGFMMWNPIATTRFFSGQVIPAARTAHGFEAVLAVLAIFLWHFYNVHIRTFNRSMFTGKMNEKEMLHEHPLELADIKAGTAKPVLDPKSVSRRERVFWPTYGVVAALLFVGIYWFATFEQTALATVQPEETVVVFAPLTPTPLPTAPPTPTLAPTPTGGATPEAGTPEAGVSTTWEGGIGAIFKTTCTGCHGSDTQLGGLNLSSYQSALAGGKSGPGIVPGDPNASMIVKKQSAGGHPGQLSADELDQITKWIQSGALEK
jgi:formate dehydrogenase gamma subunit